MTDSKKSKSPSPPRDLPSAVERLLRKYCSDSQSPRRDEVERLANDLLLRNHELDAKVSSLRTIIQQLEAYRDRYVDLYELAPAGYATLDEEGFVQEINLAGSQLLATDRAELIGYPFESHVRPEDREKLRNQLHRCCAGNHVIRCEVGIVARDGKQITVQVRGVPLKSLESDVTFCKIAMTDITERKLVEEVIRASEANYWAVFHTASDAIFVHDVDTGKILDANQKATEMYGYSTEELWQLSIDVLSEGHPPYSQAEIIQLMTHAVSGTPQLFPWKCRDKSGRLFWAEVNLKKTVLNGIPRLLAIVRDITERKNAEIELQQRIEELEKGIAELTGKTKL
jgi:PAS domain S-box-containing protein